MRVQRRITGRSFDWATAAPWLTAALLLPVGALLVAYLWSTANETPPAPSAVAALDPGRPSPTAEPDMPLPTPVAPPPRVDSPPNDPRLLPAPAEPPGEVARVDPPAVSTPTPAPTTIDPIPPVGATEPPDGPTDSSARYGNRRGQKKGNALSGFGGGEKTETSVRIALDWLAVHQRKDGAWDRFHFNAACPEDDVCREVAVELEKLSADPAITGLVLLAFLGAGHTDREGDYQPAVSRGLAYLLLTQREGGSFAPVNTLEMYNHAIATLALAEAHAMTGERLLRAPLEAAVAHIVRAQQPGGGWGYTSDLATDRNDMSVTGWVTMALAGAEGVGISVPDDTILALIDFVAASTLPDGQINYAREGDRVIANAIGSTDPPYSPATTAIGMLVRQLLGYREDSPILRQQERFLLTQPPDSRLRKGGDKSEFHSDYYWYYGTLAMFNQGGDGWEQWNDHLLDALLPFQDRSPDVRGKRPSAPLPLPPREGDGGSVAAALPLPAREGAGGRVHSYGSFTAFGAGWGKWGRAGGKVYSTALAVLMLESYYRYVPAYLSSAGLIQESTLRTGLSRPDADRTPLVQAASLVSPDVGETVLLDLLRDGDAGIRLRAALGLARQGSPMGEPTLRAALPGTTGGEREAVEAALAKIAAIEWPATYGPVVRIDHQRGVFVFSTEGRPVYAGMKVEVQRDGRVIAHGVVTRRLTDHNLAAAKLEAAPEAADIRAGDSVKPKR